LVIDACVLFARIPRGIALNAAEAGLVTPFWSARILEEWRRSAARKPGGEAAALIAGAMNARWPQAMLPADPAREAAIHLPDPADAHVAAVAAGHAQAILTFNIRDFPRRTLAGLGLEALHPDGLYWLLYSQAPGVMGAILREIAAEHGAATGDEVRRLLKRSLLPRLGKAVAADW
ncbi:MAG: PIN domain-containing protein, partial [Pseudomonadota bacterium]